MLIQSFRKIAGAHPVGVGWTGHTPPGRVFVVNPAKDAFMGDKGDLTSEKGALIADIDAHPGFHVREIVFLQDGRRLGEPRPLTPEPKP